MVERLFSSRTLYRTLALFFRYPEEPLNPRLISRHTGTDLKCVHRELKKLEETGMGIRNAVAIRQDVGEIEGPPARGSAAAREKRSGGRIQPIPSVRNCSLTFVSQPSPYIALAIPVTAAPPFWCPGI